ncbi:MAG: polyprenol monophosphomannose synthase, partial [Bacteroidetes bacterium]|nr:polyprenol monophosphomannose synthase [Bacteroidota bacterium]
LIKRTAKLGLGTAYIEGFKFALKNQYDLIFEMDADYSHDPKEIKNFLKKIKTYDLVLGSRYKEGVNVVNWPLKRLLLSYFANGYTRYITGLKVCDATGGFKCFRREVIEAIDLDKVKSNGYAFQIEMTFKAWKKGYKICEIPIIFIDRTEGHSKMSKKIVHEAIFMVWKLRIRSIFGRL